ncbi:MAG: signal peptide peptidase SppA [Candidatus Brocadiales bacterium]
MDDRQAKKEGRGMGFWAAAAVAVFFFLSSLLLVAMILGSLTAWSPLLGEGKALNKEYTEEIVEGSGDKKIVLINIKGIISTASDSFLSGGSGTVEGFKKQLKHIKEDEQVEAVLLLIESPGGGITASDIIYNEILRYKEEKGKKVVVLMGDIAASGGYYISVAADKIIAHPTTITGSIGVILPLVNVSELINKYGIEDASITSGDMKDIGSPTRPMRPEEKAVLDSIIQQMYERFVSVIATGRNMPVEEVKKLADGRIYTAQQALEGGLIDQLGYLSDAIETTKEMAGLDEALVVRYKRKWSLGDLFSIVQKITLPGVRQFFQWPEMETPRLMYLWLPGFTQDTTTR